MNKHSILEAIILKEKMGSDALDSFLTKLFSYLKLNKEIYLLREVLYFLKSKRNLSSYDLLIKSAKKIDDDDLRKIKNENVSLFNPSPFKIAYKIDDTLIGGYIIETKGKRIDKSFKNQLLSLYQELNA